MGNQKGAGTALSLAKIVKVYCPNCKKGLHNVWHIDTKDKSRQYLEIKRCKEDGKSQTVKCECPCQTHYLYDGRPVPVGQIPPERPELKIKTLKYSPEIEKYNKWAQEQRDKQPKIPESNPRLGIRGDEGDQVTKITKPEQENWAGDWAKRFKENIK